MGKMNVKSQIAFVKKALEKKGISPDTVDVQALVDPELTYKENLENILEMIGKGSSIDPTKKTGSKELEIIDNPACSEKKQIKREIHAHMRADEKLQDLKAQAKNAEVRCQCQECSLMGLADPHSCDSISIRDFYTPEFLDEIIREGEIEKDPRIKAAMDKLLSMMENQQFDVLARAIFKPGKNQKPSDAWSFSNRLIMFLFGTEDARGYQQWQAVGRYVKQGSHAFYILAPLKRKAFKTVIEEDPNTHEEVKKKVPYEYIYGFRGVPVFRFEDTEGKPIIEDKIDYNIPFELTPLIQDLKLDVKAIPGGSNYYGFYNPIRKQIRVVTPDIDVLLHEMSHAVDDKLHGLVGGQHKDQEVVAEFSAATVGYLMGYDLKLGNMFEYIRHYSFTELLKQLNRVEEVVNYFILHTTKGEAAQTVAAMIHDSQAALTEYGLETIIARKDPVQGDFKTQLNPKRKVLAKIGGPGDVYKFVQSMQDYDREFGKVLYLDNKNNVTGIETVTVGSLNSAVVHPREIFKGAITHNAGSIIFIHNHPSGNPEPSREDIAVSKKLKETGEIVGISVLDSMIVGRERYYSMKEDPPGEKIFDSHSQRMKYSIYQDKKLFANEDDKTEANNIFKMLIRIYPNSVIELRENFAHPTVHQKTIKQFPAVNDSGSFLDEFEAWLDSPDL